jgi:hypothetical protein
MAELSSIINQLTVTGTYQLLHSIAEEYTFFSDSSETFTNTGHILGHKIILSKFKRIETTQCIKLEIINRKLENPQIFGDQTIHLNNS